MRTALPFALVSALVCLSVASCGGGEERRGAGRSSPTTGSFTLEEETWHCSGTVDVDRVEVIVTNEDADAIHLDGGCTGRIGELHVVQHRLDGVKVKAGAHDLVVEGGRIECRGRKEEAHQDGIQAMGGTRVTFENLRIDCVSASNSGLFLRHGGIRSDVPPTDIVCVRCTVRGGSSYAVRINESIRSGVRNSTICEAPFGSIRILDGAVDPVNEGNRIIRCD
jgi:hypothetical protein